MIRTLRNAQKRKVPWLKGKRTLTFLLFLLFFFTKFIQFTTFLNIYFLLIASCPASEQLLLNCYWKICYPQNFLYKRQILLKSFRMIFYLVSSLLWLNVAAWLIFVCFDQCCITISNTLENNLSPGCQTSNTKWRTS